MRLYWFLKVHCVLFVDLIPIHEVILFALWGTAFSGKVSHPPAVKAGPLWFGGGSLGLSDVRSERASIESVWWGSGTSGSVHRDWLVSHPSRGVARVILILWGSLIGSEWGAKPLSLSEGWEGSWSVRRPSVCFEDVDDLSSLGGTNGPSFNFVIIAQFRVEFQQIFSHTGV